jgi:hypothetical protein
MPVRSNIFQRLVAAIHSDLGQGWRVTESRLLADSRTGEQREVDIVAEASIGGYPITISVEVRDRGRRADVTWVESMAQKHADLPTSKLALWSPTGFSSSAIAKAKALGVEVITPLGVDHAPWARLARDLIGGLVKFVRPSFDPVVDVKLGNGTMVRWPASSATILKRKDGDVEAPVGAILQQIADSPAVRTTMLDHAPEGSGSFHAIYEPPFLCEVEGPGGEKGDLNRLVIGITTLCEVAAVAVRSVVHRGVATTLAEADVADGTLQLVVREPSTGPVTVTAVHLRGARARAAQQKSRPRA